MIGGPRAQEEPLGGAAYVWSAARLSIDFVLDVAQISRGQGDLLDPLLMTAILEANQAAVRRDPQLTRIYGDAQSALPDDLRRPISVNALAKSVRLPFETVRRRLNSFIDAGVCLRTAAGVYVPHAVVTSPSYIALQAARVERLGRFLGELARKQTVAAASPTPDVRAADRALAEYMLRASDSLIELAQGPMNGFVLLGLCAVNLESVGSNWPIAGIADLARRANPCSVAPIAARLATPGETVRRRLFALQALGLAERRDHGWMATSPPALRERIRQVAVDNEMNLRRLRSRMQDLGLPVESGPPAAS